MPFQYALDPSAGFAYLKAHRIVTDEEMMESFRSLNELQGLPAGAKVLMDARDVRRVEVTSEGIGLLVELAEEEAPNEFAAAVLTSDAVVRGMVRMFELRRGERTQSSDIGIFQDLSKALAWLDVPVHVLVRVGTPESRVPQPEPRAAHSAPRATHGD